MRENWRLLKRNHAFRNLFIGQLVSCFGSGMHIIGANWFVLEKTGFSSAVGWLMAVLFASGLISMALSGPVIDRYKRRNILITLDLVRALVIILIPISMRLNTFSIWQLYLMTFINGMAFYISIPAGRAFMQEILKPAEILSGNSLLEICLQCGAFLAAGLLGFVIRYLGFGAVLTIDSITFVISCIFLMRISYLPINVMSQRSNFIADFKEGWRYLSSEPKIFVLGLVTFFPTIIGMVSNVIGPHYVARGLGRGAITFGIVDMSYGVGAFVAGLFAITLLQRFKRAALVQFFIGTAVIVLLSLPFILYVQFAIAGMLFLGTSNALQRIVFNTELMEKIPNNLMGRSMTAFMFTTLILQVFSSLFVGYAIDISSLHLGFFYLAFIAILTLAGFAWSGAKRGIVAHPSEIVT